MSVRAVATEIVRRLQGAGFDAYWVGGCVRDLLLGREPADYDVATSAHPAQVEALFPHTVAVGRAFGVVLVVEGNHQVQVATFRAEAGYADGRHPSTVSFCDAQADARRRDFTVNGLFYDPFRGIVHDWVGGRADVTARLLQTIGDPYARFAEDHLRPLRAVRFAAQLAFTLAPATREAVQASAALLATVSAERVRDELLKLFRPPHAGRGLELLRETGLLSHVLPEVAVCIGCEQPPEFHPEGDVYTHVRLMLERLPADAPPALAWAALLHDIGKPPTASRDAAGRIRFNQHADVGAILAETRLERLRFPRRDLDVIVACVRQHMQFKDVRQMRKSTLRRLLMRPTFPLELELHRLDCLASHRALDHYEFVRAAAEELARQPDIRPPLLRGRDLLALGMPPGPAVGALLREVRERQLLDELRTADEARAWVVARRALAP